MSTQYIYGQPCDQEVIVEDFSTDLSDYSVVTGTSASFTIVSGELKIANNGVANAIERTLSASPTFSAETIVYDFRINASGVNDVGSIYIPWSNGYYLQMVPRRASAVDASRLCRMITPANSTGYSLYGSALTFDLDYRITVTISYGSGDITIVLSQGGSTLATTVLSATAVGGTTSILRFVSHPDSSGIVYYDDVSITEVC